MKQFLTDCWSPTSLGNKELDDFAIANMAGEIKSGICTLCLVFFILLVSGAALNFFMGLDQLYLYTYSVLAFLALHMYWAALRSGKIEELYLLGTNLLVISSTALVLLAHKVGSFSVPLLVVIVLVFTVMALVPWGLKQALPIIGLIYFVFTVSSWSVQHRFDLDTLCMLQFLMTSSSIIVLTIIARNTVLRRKEIKYLYELNLVHRKLEKISCQDPLTGAWNRRYLNNRYKEERQLHSESGKDFYFALFDIDDFKQINDTLGHDCGDKILQWITTSFQESLGVNDILVRMGGDEFAVMISSPEPEKLLHRGIKKFAMREMKFGNSSESKVSISFGLTRVTPDMIGSFKDVYQSADRALYKAKEKSGNAIVRGNFPGEQAVPASQSQEIIAT